MGIKLTQEQLDESERERYRYHAVALLCVRNESAEFSAAPRNDELSMIYHDKVRQTLFGQPKPPLTRSKPFIDWTWWLVLFAVMVAVIAASAVRT